MVVPADIYDPSWAYIDAWDRPELGIVQKVEFNDSSTVYGGIDSVTVSGFFLESVLNNIVFLDESPEEQKVYVPEPSRPTFSHNRQDTKVYADPVGGLYYENSSGDVVSADNGHVVSMDGLTEVDYNDAFGSMWGNPDSGICSFDYYYLGKTQIHTVPYYGDGAGKTYDIEFEDDKGNVFYRNEFGTLTQAVGVVEQAGDTFLARKRKWNALESDTYGHYYTVTVKGPWQRTDALEPVTEGDSIDIVLKWARRMMGDWILYEEPAITGVQKKVDPSFQYLGDLLYSTLYEVGASFRLEYLFDKNINILSVYKGANRTQDDETIIVPDPVLPDGYTQLDYIESTGTQWIDTGMTADDSSVFTVDFMLYKAPMTYAGIFGSRTITGYAGASMFYVATNPTSYNCSFGRNDISSTPVFGHIDSSRHILELSSSGAFFDSTLVQSFTQIQFSTPGNVFVFTSNDGDANFPSPNLRIYSFKMTKTGGELDLYPAKRASDGAVGMYDMANGRFLANVGTGSFIAGPESEIPSHEVTVPNGNPWAVFSDTWGTISGYSASRDESNYRNTCFVLYDYDCPTEWDSSGLPVVHSRLIKEFNDSGYSVITGARAWINSEHRRGYNTEHVGDPDEPAQETYLDMRDEKPSCDNAWSHDAVEVSGSDSSCLQQAEEQVLNTSDSGWTGDMKSVYEAFEQSTHDRGIRYLKDNYGVVTNLDAGTVNARDYLKTFDLGDMVEFAVSTVGLQTTGRIIEVEEAYESGRVDIRLTIGDEQLTTIKKAKLASK